jgi:hypothetical protein
MNITLKKNLIPLYFKCLNGEVSWEETGLLHNLAEEQKPQIIELYSMLKPYFETDDEYCEFYLPIILRVYIDLLNSGRFYIENEWKMDLYLLINPHDVVKHTKIGFDLVRKALQNFENIDYDVELCRLIANNYIGEININITASNIKEKLLKLKRDRKISKILS